MAVLDLGRQPFFANKNRAFWNLQMAGWAGAMVLRGASGIANGQPVEFLLPVVVSTVTGYSISLILSVIYSLVIDRRPLITWGTTAIMLGLAGGLYAFIDAWVFMTIRQAQEVSFTTLLLGSFYINFTLLGAWSALYYAINFYVRAEEQSDQLLRLEAQATSAQLTMLRYQLNPHFLFNTLNSISTLVLLKETEPANAMLSRLSSFLRFTLVNEASAMVTVDQEVETLKLYLDIEKMRFEERLRTRFDIADSARSGLVPSLLLQPLVENAVKYAVTPKEEGADITITASRSGSRLRLSVSDTGPGLQQGRNQETSSTGVGMVNIRERLSQAYGEDHRIDVLSNPGGGFEVLIEIPFRSGGETPADGADQMRTIPA